MKERIYSQLEPATKQQLAKYAARARTSESQVIEAAVEAFFSPQTLDKRDAAVTRRLNDISRQLDRHRRDLMITSETLALFVHYQLAVAPPIPVADQAAARAKANEAMEQFMTHLVRRLENGRSIIASVVERFQPAESDFFTVDLDEPEDDDLSGDGHG